jgi:hypothetical protein
MIQTSAAVHKKDPVCIIGKVSKAYFYISSLRVQAIPV